MALAAFYGFGEHVGELRSVGEGADEGQESSPLVGLVAGLRQGNERGDGCAVAFDHETFVLVAHPAEDSGEAPLHRSYTITSVMLTS